MQKRLKTLSRLNELKCFRENGLTKFKEIDELNADKLKREQQQLKVCLFSDFLSILLGTLRD
jgi:hypothetical protein